MKCRFLALVGALMLSGGSAAFADVVTITFSGTLTSGTDYTGVFGLPPGTSLTADPFSVVYQFDTTAGALSAQSDGHGTTIGYNLTGDSFTATLTINGVSQSIGPQGSSYTRNTFGSPYGTPTSSVFVGASYAAPNPYLTTITVQNSVISPTPFFPIGFGNFTYTLTAADTSSGSFEIFNCTTCNPYYPTSLTPDETFAGGSFATQTVSESDQLAETPLPSTWIMMLPVLGGLAFVGYRQRNSTAHHKFA